MPNFKLTSKPAILKNHVLTIDYDKKNSNGALLTQLESIVNIINKNGAPKGATQQMVILGAILVTQQLIADGYHVRSANNSRLHQALSNVPLIKELKSADDNKLGTSFALRAFYQWYQAKAFNNDQRLAENPICGMKDSYKTFEPVLNKLAQELPEITKPHYRLLSANKDISTTNYSIEVKVEAKAVQETSSSWTNILTLGFFGNNAAPTVAKPAQDVEEENSDKAALPSAL